MSHLWNPLATTRQLEESNANNVLPGELQDSIRFYTARITQAAGILLRLPQDIAAQAVVVLMRFWVVEKLMQYEFSVGNAISFLAPCNDIIFTTHQVRSITLELIVSSYRTSPPPRSTSLPKSPPPPAPSAASQTSTPTCSPSLTSLTPLRARLKTTQSPTTSPSPPTTPFAPVFLPSKARSCTPQASQQRCTLHIRTRSP
jgi:hypothetical protein